MLTTALREILQAELQLVINTPISSCENIPVGGGSINQTWQLIINKKEKYFCKINSAEKYPRLFEKERNGLQTLRSKNIFSIPNIILYTVIEKFQVLILEWIEPALPKESFWKDFGEQLAALHALTQDHFGLAEDNYMGALPQSNGMEKNWVDFFIQHRLEPQIKMAVNKQLIQLNDLSYFESLHKMLPNIFPDEPPALLHGDLWNGNFICDEMQRPVLIDPAIYYGHKAIDLGMTTLFGGFENKFYNAYFSQCQVPENYKEQWEICNLYPLLIHLNLFGSSYYSQVMAIVKKYC